MDVRFTLPEFSGPLDLLLYLVKREEIDVRDIPVAAVADQFKAHLDILRAVDLDQAGDFVVMLTTLMEIKSRLLLPQPAAADTPEAKAEADDPRRQLVQQLLEYKKYKEAAARLEGRAAEAGKRLPRHAVALPEGPTGPPTVRAVELWDLVSAFGRIVAETEALRPREVVSDDTPQQVYRDLILGRLSEADGVAFADLFTPPWHRLRLIGLFLAVLELIKLRSIVLEQGEPFGPIRVRAAPADLGVISHQSDTPS